MLVIRRAFTANLLPAMFLWTAGFSLLAFYRFYAPAHEALNALAALKTQLGLAFSMPAQAIAAGVLPFLFQRLQRGTHRRTSLQHLPFIMVSMSLIGVMNDAFYTFQAQLFGNNADITTLTLKTALDMLVYAPICCVPLQVVIFAFKDNQFSPSRTRQFLGKHWLQTRALPLYVASLLVWVPVLFVLYALPLGLQFPFQAIVQCLWGLILVVMTDNRDSN